MPGDSISRFFLPFYALNDWLVKLERICLYLLNYVLLTVIFIQVICRYVLFIPTPWAEEAARYAFIWLCFIGAGYMTSCNGHITIDISDMVLDKLKDPDRARTVQNKIGWIIGIIFLLILSWHYWNYIMAFKAFSRLTPGMRVNMGAVMLGPLIGFILIIYHALFCCVIPRRTIRHRQPDI